MALKDLLALADDKLHEVFHTKPHDPAKSRAPILKGIDRTADQHASATPVKGKKWFRVANGVIEFTPPFSIGGKSTHYIPTERFSDFLSGLKEAVTGGELDKEIEAGKTDKPVTTRQPRTGGTKAGWSDERRARFQASIEARNAAKASGK